MIAVDESLLLWKGRLGFKQYIPLKRSRFGIKMFKVCDRTGYTYRFKVYQGKEDPITQMTNDLPEDAVTLSMTERVVVWLLQNMMEKGHAVYADNFYSSVKLNQYLLKKGTLHCGTVRKNRVPKCVQELEVEDRRFDSLHHNGTHLFKFMDSKETYIISSFHDTSSRRKRRGPTQAVFLQPRASVDYNYYMGGVDLADQLIEPYDITRKTQKWTKKLAFHFIQMASLNAFVVAKESGYANNYLAFLDDYIERALKLTALMYIRRPLADLNVNQTASDDAVRIGAAHFPHFLPGTENGHKYKRCKVCSASGLRRETRFYCSNCPSKPPLCAAPCFERYHKVIVY